MKRFPFPLYFLVLTLATPSVRADLNSDIKALLADKVLAKGDVGVHIIRLGTGPADSTTIFEHKSAIPRIPASNLKLMTTSAALDKLGSEFQFRTTLAARSGSLALIGDGDPTTGDVEMLKKVGWGSDTLFKSWADLLTQRGIVEVGDIYVDDSIFDEQFVHPNWPNDQLHKRYEAQVAGLNLNANCLDFLVRTTRFGEIVQYRTDPLTDYATIANTCVTGNENAIWLSRRLGTNEIILRGQTNVSLDVPVSVTIHDPAMYAATYFSETLARHGVRVTGKVLRDRTIRASLNASNPTTKPVDRWVPVAVHSTPMNVVLARTNKDSMNLYAEALCKRLGYATTGESGSWETGLRAVAQMLIDLGVAESEFLLDDGCGLSKKNLISPRALARVLEHEFHGKNRDAFQKSLAIAGVDGTLEDRFKDSDLRGRVFGKSGYVLGVRSLSGYLRARDGQWYAFSILMNSLAGGDVQAKLIQERIVRAVDVSGGVVTRSE